MKKKKKLKWTSPLYVLFVYCPYILWFSEDFLTYETPLLRRGLFRRYINGKNKPKDGLFSGPTDWPVKTKNDL